MEAPPAGGPWVIQNDQAGLCLNTSVSNGIAYNSCLRPGFLYARLVARLKFFADRVGLRAVLWHQGESDSAYMSTYATVGQDPDYYSKTLSSVIAQSRTQSGLTNLAWLVANVGITLPQWKPNYTPPAGSILPLNSLGVYRRELGADPN